jgi:hypothetical protein
MTVKVTKQVRYCLDNGSVESWWTQDQVSELRGYLDAMDEDVDIAEIQTPDKMEPLRWTPADGNLPSLRVKVWKRDAEDREGYFPYMHRVDRFNVAFSYSPTDPAYPGDGVNKQSLTGRRAFSGTWVPWVFFTESDQPR